jgi:HlyD family secretion protein
MRNQLLTIAALLLLACRDSDDDTVVATGTIEVREHDVAPAVAARVLRVLVQEGDAVRAGDTLAILGTPTLGADIAQRRSRVRQSEAALRELETGPRAAEIARAEADLRAAEAEATRTADDRDRSATLLAGGAISEQQAEAAATAARTAAARRDALRNTLRLLREGTRPERVQAGRAEVAAARGALAAAEATASDLVLVAPVNGTVMGRHVEPAEVIAAGTPALTVGDVRHPWVRVYVAGPRLPLVRVGAPADAVLDAHEDTPFAGRVAAIADRAEFTPRVALTEEERADLMFAVKVELDDTTGTLKAGLPVTVRIRATEPGVAVRRRGEP